SSQIRERGAVRPDGVGPPLLTGAGSGERYLPTQWKEPARMIPVRDVLLCVRTLHPCASIAPSSSGNALIVCPPDSSGRRISTTIPGRGPCSSSCGERHYQSRQTSSKATR